MLPFLTFRIRADTSEEEISYLWHNPANLRELHHLPAATLRFWDASLTAPPGNSLVHERPYSKNLKYWGLGERGGLRVR